MSVPRGDEEYSLWSKGPAARAARVVQQVDRPGVTTWGFERLARIDDTLALFR